MEMGVNVIGYLYFSLLDNWEWGTFHPTFGIVEVDFETYERKIRNSGYFYRDIIRNNGINQTIIRKYINQMPVNKDLVK
jgi:beta-glucosidase